MLTQEQPNPPHRRPDALPPGRFSFALTLAASGFLVGLGGEHTQSVSVYSLCLVFSLFHYKTQHRFVLCAAPFRASFSTIWCYRSGRTFHHVPSPLRPASRASRSLCLPCNAVASKITCSRRLFPRYVPCWFTTHYRQEPAFLAFLVILCRLRLWRAGFWLNPLHQNTRTDARQGVLFLSALALSFLYLFLFFVFTSW